jgi:hypothetical protein
MERIIYCISFQATMPVSKQDEEDTGVYKLENHFILKYLPS